MNDNPRYVNLTFRCEDTRKAMALVRFLEDASRIVNGEGWTPGPFVFLGSTITEDDPRGTR